MTSFEGQERHSTSGWTRLGLFEHQSNVAELRKLQCSVDSERANTPKTSNGMSAAETVTIFIGCRDAELCKRQRSYAAFAILGTFQETVSETAPMEALKRGCSALLRPGINGQEIAIVFRFFAPKEGISNIPTILDQRLNHLVRCCTYQVPLSARDTHTHS